MSKKDKPKKIFRRLDDMIGSFGISNPPPEPVDDRGESKTVIEKVLDLLPEGATALIDFGGKKGKGETLNSIKKRVEKLYAEHIKDLPPESRIVTAKDIKAWILNNPQFNVNSTEFLHWFRSPDGVNVNSHVKHFGELLLALNLDHACDVEQKGYVYDYFIKDMSLYIDVDPVSLDTDDPKSKISITVDKNKMDIMQIWRNINDAREAKCRPFRFLAIKERLYKEAAREFLNEYIDWYYQKISNEV